MGSNPPQPAFLAAVKGIECMVFEPIPRQRGVYCNRTLNFRSLKAVGYDMDYTLVEYRIDVFEEEVYDAAKAYFLQLGWPVQNLRFEADRVARGLVIDLETGHIVKANRFGYVKSAMHGTRMLDYSEQREAYSQILVDLSDSRWVFLNTLFSLSEGCLFAQLVDRLDQGHLPKVLSYGELYRHVRNAVDTQHLEGRLKAGIAADPARYVLPDPETPLALLDQKSAGKKLLLITNSEWEFTAPMMAHAFDPYLPDGMNWRKLFDLVICGARKPDFFTDRAPFFEVVTEEGLLRPLRGPLQPGGAYVGGCALQVEQDLGIAGDEILYVGDHIFGDVHQSKRQLRWRTCLILRELEAEISALASFFSVEQILARGMEEKEGLEQELDQLRLALLRGRHGYGNGQAQDVHELEDQIQERKQRLKQLDEAIAPLAQKASRLAHPRWGLLTRAGNDKSHLARQVERYADIYTSRVSNFLRATPYVYLRSPRGSLPHDPGGPPLMPAL